MSPTGPGPNDPASAYPTDDDGGGGGGSGLFSNEVTTDQVDAVLRMTDPGPYVDIWVNQREGLFDPNAYEDAGCGVSLRNAAGPLAQQSSVLLTADYRAQIRMYVPTAQGQNPIQIQKAADGVMLFAVDHLGNPILTSPNGTQYQLKVDDSGAVTTSEV